MAIKVGGTTVVDDSRQLSNIASVDATTVAALGAAGVGGGGTAEFTASENIAAGSAVAINSSGEIENVEATLGSTAAGNSTEVMAYDGQYSKMLFHPIQAKFINFHNDQNGYPQGQVLTYDEANGQTSAQGSIQLNSAPSEYISAAYNTADDYYMVAMAEPSNSRIRAYTFVPNVSQTSYYSANNLIVNNLGNYNDVNISYDSSLNKFILVFQRGNDTWCYVLSANPSSSYAITSHSNQNMQMSNALRGLEIATNNSGQFVIVGDNNTSSDKSYFPFTVNSSNTITAGSVTQLANFYSSGNESAQDIVYNPDDGKFLVSYDGYDSSAATHSLRFKVLTVTNNSGSLGSEYTLFSQSSAPRPANGLSYNSVSGLAVAFIRYQSQFGNTNPYICPITVTGTAVSFGTPYYSDSRNYSSNRDVSLATNDSDASSSLVFVGSATSSGAGIRAFSAYQSVTTNNSAFIGISDETISSGSTGDVTVVGGINSQLSNLTPPNKYYVTASGNLSTTSGSVYAGIATGSTKLLVKG